MRRAVTWEDTSPNPALHVTAARLRIGIKPNGCGWAAARDREAFGGFMGWITDLLKEIPSAARYKAELEQLASEHGILKSENAVLQSKLKAAEEKIRNLEEQLSDRHSQHLNETAVQILLFVVDSPDCTTETLAQHLELRPEKIRYYRDELTQHRYLDYGLTWDDREYYQLTPKGRKMLNDKQLL